MNQTKPPKKKAPAKKKPSEAPPVEPQSSPQPKKTGRADWDDDDGGPQAAVEKAQFMIYDAWEAPTRRKAVTLAKKALKLSADCADAYVLLAEETADTLEEALDLYRKGVEAGERALGKETFTESVGYFWGFIKTRPYMRARAGLAQSLWETGQHEEAVEHYWDMLRLNPNDNQGIRELLMPCLIVLGHDKDAERLFKMYREDGMAVWMYSRALLDFRKHGDSPAADKSLKAALEENKHVPAYLYGDKKMPRYLPELYGWGDEDEAVYYVHGNKAAWEATPGALEWLADKEYKAWVQASFPNLQ